MKRFFKVKFVRKDEMVVQVETDNDTAYLGDQLEISDEEGIAWFEKDAWENMEWDEEQEITEQEALDFVVTGRMIDVPMATLEQDTFTVEEQEEREQRQRKYQEFFKAHA